ALSLRSEDQGSRLRASPGFRDVRTGDDAFDGELVVEGSAAIAHALFDGETRRLTLLAFRGCTPQDGAWSSARSMPASVSLHEGTLAARLTHGARARMASELAACVRTLLELARCLQVPDDCAPRLASNLRRDPLPAVRLANLRALLGEFPQHPVQLEAVTAAAGDADAEVRLEAALALGAKGQRILLELASDPSTDPAAVARALASLGAGLPPETGCAILEDALRGGRSRTARAALEALGRVGGRLVLEALSRVLSAEDGGMAAAAADALGATSDAEAEPHLLGALGRSRDEAVREAAARALGSTGTAKAVPALRDLFDDAGEDRAVRRAARTAIASIQARLPGGLPGRLALAGADAGRLAFPADSGQLSLEEAEPRVEPDD
ncbi:MAG TPA: HEAT repeat domain-containing protein, partial [Vicinamibacteria bacterium]|nr:HEAT repeat domain-containing protein [Vicinamibacteria bacterium]